MRKLSLIFNIILTIVILMQSAFLGEVDSEIFKYEVIVISIYVMVNGFVYTQNIMHPYMVLCFMINLFLCSRIWLDVFFEWMPYYYTTYFSSYPFTNVTQKLMCMMIVLAFVGLNIGMIFYYEMYKDNSKGDIIELEEYGKVKYYSKIIIVLCSLPVIYMSYESYQFIQNYGYAAKYIAVQTGQVKENNVLGHFSVLFQVGFFCFLAASPRKKEFFRYSALFLLVMMTTLLSGGRGTFASFMGTFFTYISIYKKRMPVKYLLIIALILISLFQFTSAYRDSKGGDISFDISNIVKPFFHSQGVSITVLGYATQLESNGWLDIAYPVVAYFDEKTNDEYGKEKTEYNYPYRMSASINPSMYSKGMGTGSSFIAEAYSAGGLLCVFIISLILGWMINVSLMKFGSSFLGVVALLMFWQSIYTMPRAALLGWLIPVVKWMLFLMLIKYLSAKFKLC